MAAALHDAFALGAFASQLARAADRLGLFAGLLFRWLLEMVAGFHFPKQAFALHFLLQGPQRLVHIIIAHNDLYYGKIS